MNIPSKTALLDRDKLIRTIQELCEGLNVANNSIPSKVSDLTNDSGYLTASNVQNKANKTIIVNYGTSSTTTTLSENVYYIWGEVASLSLTLGTPSDASKLSEYMFEFQSGSTPTSLNFTSSDIKFPETPTIEANKRYQVRIVNNIALIVGVSTV